MKKQIQVVSIPHSGTRSMMQALGCGYHHMFIRENQYWQGFKEKILVCPLRDPKEVWKSWVKRDNAKRGAVSLDLFEKQYQHLKNMDAEYDLFYIPVDRTNFDLLEELSERVGFHVSLSKIGSMDAPTETDHEEPDWDYIYNLPMIKRFYDFN